MATARYDTLLEATTESSELKADLAETIACKRRLINENEELHGQLISIREILLTKLPDKLENIDMNQINISNYSLLTSKEFDVLNNKAVNNLSTLELVKVWLHRFFSFLSQVSKSIFFKKVFSSIIQFSTFLSYIVHAKEIYLWKKCNNL